MRNRKLKSEDLKQTEARLVSNQQLRVQYHTRVSATLGSITSRCSGKEPALLPRTLAADIFLQFLNIYA